MNSGNVRISSVGLAVPPLSVGQDEALQLIQEHYADDLNLSTIDIMTKVFSHPGIQKRHFALDDVEDLFSESPDDRIERFRVWAVRLGSEAAEIAMRQAGIEPKDVGAIIVNTCTGYLCPGLSTYLIESLGLSRTIQAYDLVGAGCGGAVANLRMGESVQRNLQNGVTLCVAVEICSATFQMDNDVSLIISNALFGDGAAAAILSNGPSGMAVIAGSSFYAPENRDDIRYVYRDGQLWNQLSRDLPEIARGHLGGMVKGFLAGNGLTIRDVQHWAVHPGGEKVLREIEAELDMDLNSREFRSARAVMSQYGNISSPTVMFVLQDILQNNIRGGDLCLMLSFGAGFSAHAILLRA